MGLVKLLLLLALVGHALDLPDWREDRPW